ncbi:hypothetical protein D3C80_2159230 [compost metagenome]
MCHDQAHIIHYVEPASTCISFLDTVEVPMVDLSDGHRPIVIHGVYPPTRSYNVVQWVEWGGYLTQPRIVLRL